MNWGRRNKNIIYIRHGEDKMDGYKYDESLTKRGKKEARKLAHQLISYHGIPDIIYYSPYYRTRQTLKQMLSVIAEYTDTKVHKICDYRISRYFTQNQRQNPDIRRDTGKHNPPIHEDYKDFKRRVKEHLIEAESKRDCNVIWCITHTLVLERIIHLKNLSHEFEIPFLDTVAI